MEKASTAYQNVLGIMSRANNDLHRHCTYVENVLRAKKFVHAAKEVLL